jgi:hypothetical protein
MNTALNHLAFIIGMPGSGKLSRVIKKIDNKQICYNPDEYYTYIEGNDKASNVFVLELMNIPDSGEREKLPEWKEYQGKIFDPKNKLLIFNHFEYNIQDAETSRIKLNLLEKVMMESKCRVIIYPLFTLLPSLILFIPMN